MEYLPTGWISSNVQLGPKVLFSRQQVLPLQPVNNKRIKVAVRC